MQAMLYAKDQTNMRTSRTQEEFVAELSSLIKSEGVEALSVGEIAARLRCSRRRLYEIAPTKEDLLLYVARLQFEQSLAAGHAAAQEASTPDKRLIAYLEAGLRPAHQLSAAFLADLERVPEGRDIFDRYQLGRSEGARSILEEGVRQGVFKPLNSEVVSEVLLATAHRLRQRDFLQRAGLTMLEAFEDAYKLVLHGLLRHEN